MATSTTIAKAILRLQMALLDGVAHSEGDLLAAAALLSRPDYEHVVEERSIESLCGHPLCPNPLASDRRRRGRYHISLREHRVYDLEETYKYCSEACLVGSRAFAASLPDERTSDLNLAKVEEILARFDRLREGKGPEFGLEVELGISNLTIQEKEVSGKGEVSLDEWIGPSNAIEGYVPQLDQKRVTKVEQKKVNKMVEDREVGNLDFASYINFEDEGNGAGSLTVGTQNASEIITRQLDDMILTEKKSKKSKASSKSSKPRKHKISSLNESHSTSRASVSNQNYLNVLEGVNSLTQQNLGPYVFNYSVENHSEEPEKIHCLESGTESTQQSSRNQETGGVLKKNTAIKTALKSSGSKNIGRSVKWADQKENVTLNEREEDLKEIPVYMNEENDHFLRAEQENIAQEERKEDLNEIPVVMNEENDHTLRLASAQVCAAALTEAAEAVASGKSDPEGAVSEAGILILPQPQNVNDEKIHEDTDAFEFDNGYVKWPKKTVLLDTDIFEVEDSWHDTPPDGFGLTLSSFATMFMALFGWITRSSLAYIYGRDENSQDDYLVIDGREYPRKMVLADGQSYEIRKTIDGCICRVLPGLVMDLMLPVPVSSVEKAMGQLLDTMSFMEALPSFRLREWQVIVVLFLEALSVHRLPALTPYVTNKGVLMRKMLNAAQIGIEEYDTMKELIIPLGRFPESSRGIGG